jgi:hypothetical protein
MGLGSKLLRCLKRDKVRFFTWLKSSLLSLKNGPLCHIWHILNSENSEVTSLEESFNQTLPVALMPHVGAGHGKDTHSS